MYTKKLFPEQYHYIEHYEKNGVSAMKSSEIKVIYNGEADYNGVTYQLIVMNNGQIFICVNELISVSTISESRGSVLGHTYTRRFESGDFTGYAEWNVTYVLSEQYYDHIKSYNLVGANGIHSFFNVYEKFVEDASSPAYVGLGNARTSSGLYYDMGVAVGRDKATTFCNIATGIDTWFWYFFDSFF